MTKKVLIAGVGGVGVSAAHLLSQIPELELYLGDLRKERMRAKAMCIKDCAYFENRANRFPAVQPLALDLMNIDQTRRQLEEIRPEVILNLSSLLSAQRIRSSVPPAVARKIYDANPVGTGLRPWAPGPALLLTNLMQAVKDSGIDTHVVNAAGCDYLHVALDKLGLAPTCGLGDFALTEPALRRIVEEVCGVDTQGATVHLAAHHSIVMPLAFEGVTENIPYYIRIEKNGEDLAAGIDFEKDIFPHLPTHNGWPIDAEASDQEQTAAHAVKIVKALLFDTQENMNVPGPNGLPGCYPVTVGAGGVTVVPPPNTSLEALVAINEIGNLAEGFAEIRDDGTMVATDRTVELVEELFGIDWKYKAFAPHQAMEAYREISEAFDNFRSQYAS